MSSLLLLILVGCATDGQQAPATEVVEHPAPSLDLEPRPAPGSQEMPPDADCMKQCARQNMARAVAADVIEADCRRSCAQQSDDIKPVLAVP